MEAISVTSQQVDSASLNPNTEVSSKTDGKKKGKLVQRNYVMNDVGALRKKKRHEARKQEFLLAKEAKDCSNVVVQMKASFFDYTKAKFIDEVQENDVLMISTMGKLLKLQLSPREMPMLNTLWTSPSWQRIWLTLLKLLPTQQPAK